MRSWPAAGRLGGRAPILGRTAEDGEHREARKQRRDAEIGERSGGLVVGIVLAIWTASGYVGAFSRAMNRIYEIDEGRPFWKKKPAQLLITVILSITGRSLRESKGKSPDRGRRG